MLSAILSVISFMILYLVVSQALFSPSPSIQFNWGVVFAIWIVTALSVWHDLDRDRQDWIRQEQRRRVMPHFSSNRSSGEAARSQWEDELVSYVAIHPECKTIIKNDRSKIVASDGKTPLEIDIYIPELKLGIEANGTRWHNRRAYEIDRVNSTSHSEEMYKERQCEKQGIKLLHVWDDDPPERIRLQIDEAVRDQSRLINEKH